MALINFDSIKNYFCFKCLRQVCAHWKEIVELLHLQKHCRLTSVGFPSLLFYKSKHLCINGNYSQLHEMIVLLNCRAKYDIIN